MTVLDERMVTMSLGSTVRQRRTTRLSRLRDGRYLIVPLDHSLADGPVCNARRFSELVGEIVSGGADAILVHKGRLRHVPMGTTNNCSIIAHLNGGTRYNSDQESKTLLGHVEEAVALGADAVSLHINIGSATESQQLADFGVISGECEKLGVPLMAMMYVRGPRIDDSQALTHVRHAVSIAVDLGADLIKCSLPRNPEDLESVVAASPVPVVVAGGQYRSGDAASSVDGFARQILHFGAAGVAMGRRVFEDGDPRSVVACLVNAIHNEYLGEHE